MGNKPGLVRALLTAAFLAGFAWLVLHRHEPYYHGKPLSFWLEDAYRTSAFQIEGAAPDAEGAVRELGARALPDLLQLLRSANYVPEQIMGEMSRERQFAFLHMPGVEYRETMVCWALKRLGPEAKPAVPELIRLLGRKDTEQKTAAVNCLAAIGPCAEPAVPALLAAWKSDRSNATAYGYGSLDIAVLTALRQIGPGARAALPIINKLTNGVIDPRTAELTILRIKGESCQPFIEKLRNYSSSNTWWQRVSLVSELGTNAESAVPLILSVLRKIPSTNTTDLYFAIEALGQIHRQPEVCVPAIIPFLKSNDFETRRRAVVALAAFGSDARPAVKEIIQCITPGWPVSQAATNALRVIDPTALANARKIKGPSKR
jgi:HEAT repeat protein